MNVRDGNRDNKNDTKCCSTERRRRTRIRGASTLVIFFSFGCLPLFVRGFCVQRFGRCLDSSSCKKGKSARQMRTHMKDHDETIDDSNRRDQDELLSVAPMMGHTNRHYRYFYRLLSSKTHLYTEMIPASQICSAYRRAREIYLPISKKSSSSMSVDTPNPEEIMEVVGKVIQDPSLEYTAAAAFDDRMSTLHQLLSTSSISPLSIGRNVSEQPVVLQLGGNDPATLSLASAIGSAWGAAESVAAASATGLTSAAPSTTKPIYTSINLNCGCPSNAVGGRAGGCSLMGRPELVARSVESMKESITTLWNNLEQPCPPPTVTVKHRLGIREAATFDASLDRSKNDDEAFEEVSSFVRTVSLTGAVPKFHVHTRLGLLGDFCDEDEDDQRDNKHRIRQKLWVPGSHSGVPSGQDSTVIDDAPRIKIDHKREQERARRRSRRATIKNREVPPLRPGVVTQLAEAFPHLQFVANGGIDNLEHVKKIINENYRSVSNAGGRGFIGAMVGRAVINHPCSFAAADRLLWRSNDAARTRAPTRGEVLEDYIHYCETEESLIKSYGANIVQLESLRKRLVAVPFHLFTGEAGSDEFQRRLKKLRDTKIGGRNQNQKKKNKKNQINMTAASILRAAASFVPTETLDKPVDEFVAWKDVAKFEGGLKRGSALQRVVY